jgi:hypothetical protein
MGFSPGGSASPPVPGGITNAATASASFSCPGDGTQTLAVTVNHTSQTGKRVVWAQFSGGGSFDDPGTGLIDCALVSNGGQIGAWTDGWQARLTAPVETVSAQLTGSPAAAGFLTNTVVDAFTPMNALAALFALSPAAGNFAMGANCEATLTTPNSNVPLRVRIEISLDYGGVAEAFIALGISVNGDLDGAPLDATALTTGVEGILLGGASGRSGELVVERRVNVNDGATFKPVINVQDGGGNVAFVGCTVTYEILDELTGYNPSGKSGAPFGVDPAAAVGSAEACQLYVTVQMPSLDAGSTWDGFAIIFVADYET